jgi:hypothetical protein
MSSSKQGKVSKQTEEAWTGLYAVTAVLDDQKDLANGQVTKSKIPGMLIFWWALLDSCHFALLP